LSAAVDDQINYAIRLATSELVTNAVRHGGLSLDDGIALIVDIENDIVRVDVEQPTSASGARVVEAPGVDGGFGLGIVDAVSERWGVTEGQPGHVWFEISTTPTDEWRPAP
jgi:anti-sigma regulatory factor (Ser/Thr protein kinase)